MGVAGSGHNYAVVNNVQAVKVHTGATPRAASSQLIHRRRHWVQRYQSICPGAWAAHVRRFSRTRRVERAPPIVPALAELPLEFIDYRPGTSRASQARADRPLRAFAQAPGQPDKGRTPLSGARARALRPQQQHKRDNAQAAARGLGQSGLALTPTPTLPLPALTPALTPTAVWSRSGGGVPLFRPPNWLPGRQGV